jgi:predicted transcriptional regulator
MAKSKSASTVGVHLDNAIIDQIKRIADAEDRSVSNVAARIIRRHFEAEATATEPVAVNFAQAAPAPESEPQPPAAS